jgi:hypothetical protein
MATDYLSSISPFASFDLGVVTYGADDASPLGDVSNGAPAMQTYTNTGNGSGVFVDTSWQNAIIGGLSKVVDYAIKKDAYSMGGPLANQATGQQVMVQQRQTNGTFLLLCAVGAFMLLKS